MVGLGWVVKGGISLPTPHLGVLKCCWRRASQGLWTLDSGDLMASTWSSWAKGGHAEREALSDS